MGAARRRSLIPLRKAWSGAALFSLLLVTPARGAFSADDSADTIAKYLAGLTVPAARADAAPAPVPTVEPHAPSPIPNPRTPASPASTARPGSLIPIHPPLHLSTSPPSSPPSSPASHSSSFQDPWLVHAADLDRAWKHTEEAQLAAIASWAPNNLGRAWQSNGPMFYMFSGPDFLYAHAFFPNARTYILVGNEPVGTLPDLNKIPPEVLPVALANIRRSLESVLNWSFFITKNMKTDLTQPQLSGTLPLLYVFLARAHCTIQSVTAVAIDHAGNLTETDKGETQGVRIVFAPSTLGSQPSTLFYFCTDLSDDGIKSTPGLLRFCEGQGRGVSLLKAASYLMHESGFSRVRDFLLGQSDAILQDDSGIPFRYFQPQGWSIELWGPYLGPIDTFKQYGQPDLAEMFARTPGSPLPFGFGYQWQPNRSHLMIVRRR